MKSFWLEQYERSVNVTFNLDDQIDLKKLPDTDSLRWDIAKPVVDFVVTTLIDQRIKILREPIQTTNTELEVWTFQILFRGWNCRIEVGWMPERRNANHFSLEARFRWTGLRALILPWRFKNNLDALSVEIIDALQKARRFKKIARIRLQTV